MYTVLQIKCKFKIISLNGSLKNVKRRNVPDCWR